MQIIPAPAPDFDPPATERIDYALRRAARDLALRGANRDYWLAMKAQKTKAAVALVESVTAYEPETAQEWIDLPVPLIKAAAVADSGLDVRGVALLRDECWDRAKVMEPGRFGKGDQAPPPPVAPLHSELEVARRLAYVLALGVRAEQQERDRGLIIEGETNGDAARRA